jgi:hypothetical protein
MTAPTLHTRPPTGRVPWPLILIEGGEKSGKSWACAQFSASDRIGQMYWIDLGEGSADEYGAIPGARYLVVEHDGTWDQIYGSVLAVRAEAQHAADAGQPPVVLVVDSMTAEWDLLKDWAANRARQRHNAKARKFGGRQLGDDDEPKIAMDLWNDATARHRKFMTVLMTFPGIVLVTARGKDVAKMDDAGRPVENTKEYKVEGQKALGFDATCWIRLDRGKPGRVIGLRSVHTGRRPGYDDPIELAKNWSIEGIVFDTLRCDPGSAHVRDLAELRPGKDEPESERYTVLSAAIVDAPDLERLKGWYERIGPALDGGEITRAEADALTASVRHRKAALGSAQPQVKPASSGDEERRRRRMHALYHELGVKDRDERLAIATFAVGRDITTSADLTYPAEVEAVITALETRQRQTTQGAAA